MGGFSVSDDGEASARGDGGRELSEDEIRLMSAYGDAPGAYGIKIKRTEAELGRLGARIRRAVGHPEADMYTGLLPPARWDLAGDRQAMKEEGALQVARVTKRLDAKDGEKEAFVIRLRDGDSGGRFVVGLGERASPTDLEEGGRVGVSLQKMQIEIPLPPAVDPAVTMMQVEDSPDLPYGDLGGLKVQMKHLREVIELSTLAARAVASQADACFIRVNATELVQKYIGEGARIVREIFELARSKKACIVFFDEIDAIGGERHGGGDGSGTDQEVQRTMLELLNQLDGFTARGNTKVIFATNRPEMLDPALVRPGRVDRRVEFELPDLQGRAEIFGIHARNMSVEQGIRWELLARLCPSTTGADIRCICTEAGMEAIRARRKLVTEADFLKAAHKMVAEYRKFSATPRYLASSFAT